MKWRSLLYALLGLVPSRGFSQGQTRTVPDKVELRNGFELRSLLAESLLRPYAQHRYPQWGALAGMVAHGFEHLPLQANPEAETCDCEYGLFGSSERRAPLEVEQLLDLLKLLTGGETWEQAGASMEAHGTRVFATQSADTLQRVAHTLEQLRIAMAPRLEFKIVVFEDAKPERSFELIERKQAVQLIRKLETENPSAIRYRGVIEGRPNAIQHLGEQSRRRYVLDYNVEIAEKASIADPDPKELELDRGLTLYPVLQPDGVSLGLFCMLTWRDAPKEVAKLELDLEGMQDPDQLDLSDTQVGFSVPLPPNGAFVYSPGAGAHAGLRVLVMSSRLDPMPTESAWAVLPHSLLTSTAMMNPVVYDHGEAGWRGLPPPLQSDWLIEQLRNLDPEVWEAEGAFVHTTSDHVILRADKDAVRRAQGAMAYLGRGSTRGYVVSFRRETRVADTDNGPWQTSGQPVTVPVIAGRCAFLTSGIGKTYVADYDVEVAKDSALADPVIRAAFDGTELIASVVPSGQDCLVQFDLAESALKRLRRRPASGSRVGPIWAPDVELARFSESALVRPGRAHVLAEGPLVTLEDGKRARTRLVLEVNEL